ncbi:hypothetical protein B8A07_11440 [Staphylococcus aureus]|nr:hypothetical protein B8A07_11440 [Staphylococcus aureus]
MIISKEKVFLYVEAPPTYIVCRNWEFNFSVLRLRPNLHIIVS